MQKAVAHGIYVVAILIAITSLGSGASNGLPGTALGAAGALAVWWIAVGFGVRMGYTPDDFLLSLKRFLGFDVEYDSTQEQPSEDPLR
jgi:hypothetical protein